MDTRVTRSVRLVPEKWQVVIELQEQLRLQSMGAAVDKMIDWWVASAPIRQRLKETKT